MKREFFGTDGVRGKANTHPMTVEMAQKIGQAVGILFVRRYGRADGHRLHVVVGKDTRLSGYMIENALVSGFLSSGLDVTLVGPIPTPAIAMLTRSLRADIGVMISASHNPYWDNGIKLFGSDGYKLSDDTECEIEALMRSDLTPLLAAPDLIGRAMRLDDAAGRYIENAKSAFPRGLRLDGLKIVIDCANGAAYRVAPTALWELGAEVIRIGCEPNGSNINQECGSTHPQTLCSMVVEHGAHIGITLDGDADRVLLVDETGHLIEGDQILALIAAFWEKKGWLSTRQVVATVMSNMGLERYLHDRGMELVRTAVGDRYVVEAMRDCGANLGGEQSGHIVLSQFSTTGDGLIAALQVLAVLVETGSPASEVCRRFDPFPQMLRNVSFELGRSNPLHSEQVIKATGWAEEKLGKSGRVLLRKSGTEPLIRVMAEAENPALVEEIVNELCEAIAKA